MVVRGKRWHLNVLVVDLGVVKREVSFANFEDLADASELDSRSLLVEKEFAGASLVGGARASAFWCGCGCGGLAGRVDVERGMAAAKMGRRVRSFMVR